MSDSTTSSIHTIARQVWAFLTQPTQPLSIIPQEASTNGRMVPNAAAPTPIASPTAIVPTLPAPPRSSLNGVWESLGVIGAIVAIQIAKYAWTRYQAQSTQSDQSKDTSKQRIQDLVRILQLSPHPEGGFYRRIFQSPWILKDETAITRDGSDVVHPPRLTPSTPSSDCAFHFPRPIATSIYFLLTSDHPLSHLHRLPAEEQWIWIEGDPLLIVQVDPITGECTERLLGPIRIIPPITSSAGFSSPPQHPLMQPCSTAPTNTDSTGSASSLSFPTHIVPGGCYFGARWCDPSRWTQQPTSSITEMLTLFPSPFASGPTLSSSSSASPQRFGYTLVSCVVSPGFQFEDFRLMGWKEFRELNVESAVRSKMAADGTAASIVEATVQELTEMVLDEENRGAAMNEEAKR